jgi:hypothetical protein
MLEYVAEIAEENELWQDATINRFLYASLAALITWNLLTGLFSNFADFEVDSRCKALGKCRGSTHYYGQFYLGPVGVAPRIPEDTMGYERLR